MPAVFRYKGYRFFFYSNEGDPREPLHIHVVKADKVAKFWLESEVSVAESYGMTSAELKMLAQVVDERRDLINEVWNEYFSA
ncbi:MAG: DUF4160 domain-containing protein [Sedimentisphaerales bacterium]|nr:DUF4160 domain-containing protein [Sedimentisphaerales bacterium]